LLVFLSIGGYGLWRHHGDASTDSAPIPKVTESKPAVPPVAPQERRPDIVLMTLDSLRRDHVGVYGGQTVPTPAIDALATRGIRFADAVTVVPMTRPSHASILTGLYPIRHEVRDNGSFVLDGSHQTLAEILREEGYITGAFVSAFLLDARYGLHQGFDHYDQTMSTRRSYPEEWEGLPVRPGDQTVEAALAWIQTQQRQSPDRPVFVWIHLFDAQSPYVSSEKHAAAHRGKPYRAAVALLDELVGRVAAVFRARGALDQTLWVLVGSHGEGLLEHQEETHGYFLYESTVSVPMIWHCPTRLPRPGVVKDFPAATIDVAPTLLALAGVKSTKAFDGVNVLDPPKGEPRILHLETLAPQLRHGWSPVWATRGAKAKFIEAPRPEFYDLEADPTETNELLQSDPAQLPPLRELMRTSQETTLGRPATPWTVDHAPGSDALHRIFEMGYETARLDPLSSGFADPKEMIQSFDRFQILAALLRSGRFTDAAGGCRDLLDASPRDPSAWAALGMALESLGPPAEALDAAFHAVQLQPLSRHWLLLARMLRQKGDTAASRIALEALQRIDPNDGGVSVQLGNEALADGRHDQAVAYFEQAKSQDPFRQSGAALAGIGDVRRAQGNDAAAREAYLEALKYEPGQIAALEGMAGLEQRAGRMDAQATYLRQLGKARPGTILYANELAQLYLRTDRGDEAIAIMTEYLSRNRNDVAGLGNLGNAYQTTGRLTEAVESYRKALEIAPDYAMARFNLAAALAKQGDPESAIQEYRKVLELRPDHAATFRRLAAVLATEGRLEEAFETLETAAARGLVNWDEWRETPELWTLVGDMRFGVIRSHYDR
jgi:arylsulfatase A-like enzyme/Tfp pilus assembly protein PilF